LASAVWNDRTEYSELDWTPKIPAYREEYNEDLLSSSSFAASKVSSTMMLWPATFRYSISVSVIDILSNQISTKKIAGLKREAHEIFYTIDDMFPTQN